MIIATLPWNWKIPSVVKFRMKGRSSWFPKSCEAAERDTPIKMKKKEFRQMHVGKNGISLFAITKQIEYISVFEIVHTYTFDVLVPAENAFYGLFSMCLCVYHPIQANMNLATCVSFEMINRFSCIQNDRERCICMWNSNCSNELQINFRPEIAIRFLD